MKLRNLKLKSKLKRNKISKLELKGIIKYILGLVIILNTSCNTSIKEVDDKDKNLETNKKEIDNWVEQHYKSKNFFKIIQESTGKTIDSNNIKDWYHANLIESIDLDTVKVSVLQTGVDLTHFHEDLLIVKKYQNQKLIFQIIDSTFDLKNTVSLYVFFKQYNKFSDKTKTLCYQKVVGDFYYSDLNSN